MARPAHVEGAEPETAGLLCSARMTRVIRYPLMTKKMSTQETRCPGRPSEVIEHDAEHRDGPETVDVGAMVQADGSHAVDVELARCVEGSAAFNLGFASPKKLWTP